MTNVDHAIDAQPARRSVLTDELLIVDKGGCRAEPLATDPLGSGWFDATGLTGEIGDKCAGVYGPLDATGADISINGHRYILQEEWDNAVSGCAISGP